MLYDVNVHVKECTLKIRLRSFLAELKLISKNSNFFSAQRTEDRPWVHVGLLNDQNPIETK